MISNINETMIDLVNELNCYRDEYYNKNNSIISDEEYDKKFDLLKELEESTGIIMSNSPTQTVGYEVKSSLEKVQHNHPMLSLDKTKSTDDLIRFLNNRVGVIMLKMDGLTISLRYLKGKLVSAETRGNGEIGEDITHNIIAFTNVPTTINFMDELIVDGEAIIDYETFELINNYLPEENKFKNPRNLVSGSVRQLDSRIARERKIKFVAWKLVKGVDNNDFSSRLSLLSYLGFTTVPYFKTSSGINEDEINEYINSLKSVANDYNYPIDGMVIGYNDIKYGDSLGMTSHHLRSQIAFKFYDEVVETELTNIDWTMGKTGVLTPTAVFKPVEIDGTIVERASLSNLSVMEDTLGKPYIGQIIMVSKRNAIIPKIESGVKISERRNMENNQRSTRLFY